MKKRNKILGLTAGAAALVGVSVMGTMAYLTATTQEVKNTFTVGEVGIELYESKINNDGEIVTPKEKVYGNQYTLLPSKSYDKDPTVEVTTGSEDCYLFVRFEEKDNKIYGTNDKVIEFDMVFDDKNSDWKVLNNAGGEGVVYWRVVEKNDVEKKWTLLNKNTEWCDNEGDDGDYIRVNPELTEDKMPGVHKEGEETVTIPSPELKFTAYAIQKQGFENANEAWTTAQFTN